jgi:putative acetyltransferase
MKKKIEIRRYQNGDAPYLSAIRYDTIHIINAQDYTKEQLEAWAPESSRVAPPHATDSCRSWQEQFEKTKPFVALINDMIVGFAELEPNGHLDRFYVHHQFQGQGVGSALMNALENEAHTAGLSSIYADVSITAKPFFEKKGFSVVKQQTVMIRGLALINFSMEKKAFLHLKSELLFF